MGTEVAVRRLDVGAERVRSSLTAAKRTSTKANLRQEVTAAATTHGVCRILYAHEGLDEWRAWRTRHIPDAVETPGASAAEGTGAAMWLDRLERELAAYFAGDGRAFTVPLDLRGTPFQVRVWEALRDVPFGATTTYGDVAREVAGVGAVRAVGRAVGANPVPIVVPCHRVLGRDGSLTGYGGGLPRKRLLLGIEGVVLAGESARRTVQQRLTVEPEGDTPSGAGAALTSRSRRPRSPVAGAAEAAHEGKRHG